MIQKLTPKKFVTDKDERLVAPNEMILAENVTISERADGSASILKSITSGISMAMTPQLEPDAKAEHAASRKTSAGNRYGEIVSPKIEMR